MGLTVEVTCFPALFTLYIETVRETVHQRLPCP